MLAADMVLLNQAKNLEWLAGGPLVTGDSTAPARLIQGETFGKPAQNAGGTLVLAC